MINVYKPISFTPLEVLNLIRKAKPEFKDSKMAYAGRLDPMAQGVMIILVDEECKRRDDFQNLSKTYEFEVMFGVSTDTYDQMGIIQNTNFDYQIDEVLKQIEIAVDKMKGKITLNYPPYSSKTINGEKLFSLARKGVLDSNSLPSKEIEITKFDILESKTLLLKNQVDIFTKNIRNMKGDFRQEEIISKWNKLQSDFDTKSILIQKFSVEASSGTYVRSIAVKLGEIIKLPTIASSITRTKVGEYDIADSLVLS